MSDKQRLTCADLSISCVSGQTATDKASLCVLAHCMVTAGVAAAAQAALVYVCKRAVHGGHKDIFDD